MQWMPGQKTPTPTRNFNEHRTRLPPSSPNNTGDWAVASRYMSTDSLARARLQIITTEFEEVTPTPLPQARRS